MVYADKCECCGENKTQFTLIDHPSIHEQNSAVEYKVCANCLLALTTHSLKPDQYGRLLENGHTKYEYLIHDDFYDDDGNALQSMFEGW